MIATIEHPQGTFKVDLTHPIDLSIPLSPNGPRAWYVEKMKFSPVINQYFAGSVKLGGSVNFNDVFFNPHGHGTHTECVGHISREFHNVNESLTKYFFTAHLITVTPTQNTQETEWKKLGDMIITADMIKAALGAHRPEALVVRTLPNSQEKRTKNYSSTNFPYLDDAATAWLASIGVNHLLVDLPSVDREEDGGMLKAHHAFWNYPNNTRNTATITEFVFVPDEVKDGAYILNLQTAAFVNDATPSRPVLYRII